MLPGEIELAIAIAGVAAGVAGIVWGGIRARADWVQGSATREEADREKVHELLAIKDEMIEALKRANEELREDLKRALRREEAWRKERAEYKRRLDAVEDSFRAVVTSIVSSGICGNAPECVNYRAPGERREGERRPAPADS